MNKAYGGGDRHRNGKRKRGGARTALIVAAICLLGQTPAQAAKSPLISGTETDENKEPANGPALEQESGTGGAEEADGSKQEDSQKNGEASMTYSEEQISDSLIEYGELEALLTAGNATVKSAVAGYENNLAVYQAAYDALASARRDMLDKADELEDEDGDSALISQYESSASMLSSSVKQMKKRINSLSSASSQSSLNRSVSAVVKAVQTVMSSYKEMEYQVQASEKRVEAAGAAYERAQRERTAGLAAEEELLEEEKSLISAQVSLQSAKDSADSLKSQLAVLIGRNANEIVVGEIPSAEKAELDALNLEADKEKAVIADSTVKSLRSSSAVGDAQRKLRMQKLAEAKGEEDITMDSLYQTLVVKSVQYDAELAAFEAAKRDYSALQKKYAAGLINRTQYLTGEADYLDRKSAKETASIELSQALAAYRWEIKGVG